MSIKADHWIRKMALEQGMIEPFVDRQVREGIISYGLTSYGYDMRVTNQFKVFTNVFNALVDPKNFNPRSFVDIEADHIDIPPNSFALAQSYELFRIPRTISAIVIGKSTYARCFRGDTQVALVDGTAPTLEEMAKRAETGELFWGYSLGAYGRIIVALLEAPRYIGRDSLLEITLDNGQPIHCTPDHEFLTRDGQLRQAHELKPGDSLMPLYRQLVRGYEAVYQPLNGHLLPTHRLADEWNVRHGLYEDIPDTHRHHRDYNRRNNNPWNIERMDASEHIKLHNANTFGVDFDPDSHSLAIRDAIAHLRLDPEWEDHFKQLQTNKARSFWNDEAYAQAREERNASIRASGMRNHKVAAIRDLGGDHDVYCLTVPEAGNFALEAGVFVRNCGIIINVTPLEPEWHGFVTIEISNTTPLPARIYANEGIGQVLFLESDEACEVSYADKRGKYQDQHGIVLPRIDRKA